MSRKFKLTPDPTFKKSVEIPIPGARPASVEFIFKHRNKEQLSEWLENVGKFDTDAALILDIASGWDLEDPFDDESIATLCNEYAGAGTSVLHTYVAEASGGQVRLGNLGR